VPRFLEFVGFVECIEFVELENTHALGGYVQGAAVVKLDEGIGTVVSMES